MHRSRIWARRAVAAVGSSTVALASCADDGPPGTNVETVPNEAADAFVDEPARLHVVQPFRREA